MIVPSIVDLCQKRREYLPFAALLACTTANSDLFLKHLRDKSPPLCAILVYQADNSIIFLQSQSKTRTIV